MKVKNNNGSNKVKKVSNSSDKQISGLKKYREIIISIILFMMVNITILSLNYYQSFKVADSAIAITLSSQEAGYIQDIAKNITDINLLLTENENTEAVNFEQQQKILFKQFNALKNSVKKFDTALTLLQKGGVLNEDGTQQTIQPIKIPSAVDNLERIHNIWTPFEGMIQRFLNSYDAKRINPESVKFATEYARIYTTRLLLEIDDVVNALQIQASKQANFIKIIQIIGIVLALTIFSFIVFRALRALVRSDIELANSRRETNEIMDTITEGLFLIDENYVIGEQQSKKLADIFPISDISGKKLDVILETLLSEKDLVNTRRFINQLFNRKTREHLIDDLNPLRRIFIAGDGERPDRYLRFQFTRSYEGKKIVHILVSIIDITETVEMEQRLERERRQNEQQYEILIKLLKIDSNTLATFMENAEKMTLNINRILEKKGMSSRDLEYKRQTIFREVHSFKGEASALDLGAFVHIANDIEEHLKKLKNKPDLNGNDFLKITISLEEFFKLTTELNTTRQRLLNMNLSVAEKMSADSSEQLAHFAQQIAKRQGKNVELSIIGFDHISVPKELKNKLHEILIQLLRNAIVHGIEKPEERVASGKPKNGRILVSLKQTDYYYQAFVEDDGAGINTNVIKQKLIEKKMCSEKLVATLDEQSLIRSIFLPGFSTHNGSDEDAGQGVGMDVVKDRIKSLGGKMQIDTMVGQYTKFIFNIPVAY